jgi:hypothetical protein
LQEQIEEAKSEHEEDLSRTFDRVLSVVYKVSIFPTVSFFVSKKNRIFYIFYVKYEFIRAEISTTVLPYSLLKRIKKIMVRSLIVAEKSKRQNQKSVGIFSRKIATSCYYFWLSI